MAPKVQIQLSNPCTQSWDDMETVEGGKFCNGCKKKVIDFTLLNDRQVMEIFHRNKHVCGRFTDEQLNRELRVTMHQSNAFIPAAILCTVLATGMAVSAYAAKNTERRLPVTEQDTIRPIEAIRCNSMISKDLVQPLPGSDSVSNKACTNLPAFLGGAFIGVIIKEESDTNLRSEWWWWFR